MNCGLTLPSSGLAFGQPLKSNVRPRMKTYHAVALLCFAIAALFYSLAWSQVGAGVVAFLGVVIELAGWATLSNGYDNDRSEK